MNTSINDFKNQLRSWNVAFTEENTYEELAALYQAESQKRGQEPLELEKKNPGFFAKIKNALTGSEDDELDKPDRTVGTSEDPDIQAGSVRAAKGSGLTHTITEEDLARNPDLASNGLKVGDDIELNIDAFEEGEYPAVSVQAKKAAEQEVKRDGKTLLRNVISPLDSNVVLKRGERIPEGIDKEILSDWEEREIL